MTYPIRVLHVFGELNRGGAETMIMNLFREVDKRKIVFDFVVHTEQECDYDQEIQELGGKILRVPKYVGKNHMQYTREWTKLLKEHPEYKIIHGHVRSTAAIYLHIANKMGRYTISHSHSTGSGTGVSASVKNIYQLPIRYIADYFFACTQEAGRWLFGKKTIKQSNCSILKNAIDISKFRYKPNVRNKVRDELGLDGKLVVGQIGRFHTVKNHKFTVEVFKELKKKHPSSELLLIGEGELKEEVKSLVEAYDLSSSVKFLGMRSDVNELIQGIDVLIMPSIYEGLPVTLIEAQASGTPCIVSDGISKESKITDLVTFIPLSEDPDSWARMISETSRNHRKKDYTKEIEEAGYSSSKNAQYLESFYIDLINT